MSHTCLALGGRASARRYGISRVDPIPGDRQRVSSVSADPLNHVCGGSAAGECVGLAGPEVESVGVPFGCRGSPERGGQVVDLRVGARGMSAVLTQEPV